MVVCEGYSSGAVCNNPGNSDTGNYTGCGISFDFNDLCTEFPPFYHTASGIAAANQSSLTTGGAKLKTWAKDMGYTPANPDLPTSWYNAAWAWGNSGWDGNGHYIYDGGPSGSYLVYIIYADGIYALA